MYDLYFGATPNAYKVALMLEELGADYRRLPVAVHRGAQHEPGFRALNPNAKIPVLVDHAPAGGDAPVAVFESGAILIYLAEKHGRFLPTDPLARTAVLQWLMWQMAGLGPMAGQVHHFLHYAPEPVPYGVERYSRETRRLYAVLEAALDGRDHVAGDYSIADMAIWPWVYFHALHAIDLAALPNVERYFAAIGARHAAVAAMQGLKVRATPLDDEARRHLFNMDMPGAR